MASKATITESFGACTSAVQTPETARHDTHKLHWVSTTKGRAGRFQVNQGERYRPGVGTQTMRIKTKNQWTQTCSKDLKRPHLKVLTATKQERLTRGGHKRAAEQLNYVPTPLHILQKRKRQAKMQDKKEEAIQDATDNSINVEEGNSQYNEEELEEWINQVFASLTAEVNINTAGAVNARAILTVHIA